MLSDTRGLMVASFVSYRARMRPSFLRGADYLLCFLCEKFKILGWLYRSTGGNRKLITVTVRVNEDYRGIRRTELITRRSASNLLVFFLEEGEGRVYS